MVVASAADRRVHLCQRAEALLAVGRGQRETLRRHFECGEGSMFCAADRGESAQRASPCRDPWERRRVLAIHRGQDGVEMMAP